MLDGGIAVLTRAGESWLRKLCAVSIAQKHEHAVVWETGRRQVHLAIIVEIRRDQPSSVMAWI
jgi:hypothetical protein